MSRAATCKTIQGETPRTTSTGSLTTIQPSHTAGPKDLSVAGRGDCGEYHFFAWSRWVSEKHPALPCSPACYPRWHAAMVSEEVGMADFALTPHASGLRLTSVLLIPMVFASEARDTGRGSFTVTLCARSDATIALGVYSDITVVCGSGRHIRDAVDLHACILNYKPSRRSSRGELQAGRMYVCFLVYRLARFRR
ncbi:hypothetical protein OG21DRAFT_1572441 [Imleria badia]|nr:hypothetical protein OG21DRAFT_1572441 [Imleria badia]